MVETRDGDTSIRRVNPVPTLIGLTAMVGIVYWCDRTYRHWLRENDPLAGPRARLVGFKTGYQGKRANVTEVAQLVSDVLVEVARARPTAAGP